MDKIDVAIIRELNQGGLILPGKPGFSPSYRDVSKKLGISHGTVWNRINTMYKIGVVKGSLSFPNPNLFKLMAAAYTMDVPPELDKGGVFQKLKDFDGFLSAHDFLGRMVWLTFVFRDEEDLERKLGTLKMIASTTGILSRIPFPPCPDSFTQFDARLMLQLSTNGLVSYAELGRSLNISTRSVVRKISKIGQENMIVSLANVNYGAMSGSVPADLLIFFANNRTRAFAETKVLELVKDYLIFGALFDVVGMCSLILPNVILLKELTENVRQIDGVMQCRIEIVVGHVHQPRFLVECLEKYIDDRPKLSAKPSIQTDL